MSDTTLWDIHAARNADFGRSFQFEDDANPGRVFSNWTVSFQIRQYEGAAGDPLISLGMVTNKATQGIMWLEPALFQLLIKRASLLALPGLNQPEAGSPQRFAYDLTFTTEYNYTMRVAAGAFILHPGVVRSP